MGNGVWGGRSGVSPDWLDLVDTVRAVLSTPASVAELAEAWLTSKRANESAEQAEKGNSDRARRADLGRWALLIVEAVGRSPTADDASPMKRLDLDDLSEDVLAAAIAAAKRQWSDATIARMLSTLRGFTRWLYRTGRITTDPLEGDVFRGPPRRERRPKALGEEDVERIRKAADEDPTGRQRMYSPIRDVALVRFLASTGARAEEACSATIGELDRRAERPIWRVGKSKGDKTRDVPLPKLTVEGDRRLACPAGEAGGGAAGAEGPPDRPPVRTARRDGVFGSSPGQTGARPRA